MPDYMCTENQLFVNSYVMNCESVNSGLMMFNFFLYCIAIELLFSAGTFFFQKK